MPADNPLKRMELESTADIWNSSPIHPYVNMQRLILDREGNMRLECEAADENGGRFVSDITERRIDPSNAEFMLDIVEESLEESIGSHATDAGRWMMTLEYADGTRRELEGPLTDLTLNGEPVSWILRNALVRSRYFVHGSPMNMEVMDLYLFDGGADDEDRDSLCL